MKQENRKESAFGLHKLPRKEEQIGRQDNRGAYGKAAVDGDAEAPGFLGPLGKDDVSKTSAKEEEVEKLVRKITFLNPYN